MQIVLLMAAADGVLRSTGVPGAIPSAVPEPPYKSETKGFTPRSAEGRRGVSRGLG